MKGDELFTCIFKNNTPQTVLQFLDNETNFLQDLKMMSSVPMKIFLPVAVKNWLQCLIINIYHFFVLQFLHWLWYNR